MKQQLSLELVGHSPEDGAFLSQASESRSQSRASARYALCCSMGISLFHVQTLLTSLLHRCESNIPGLRWQEMDKTRVTHGETKYHAA